MFGLEDFAGEADEQFVVFPENWPAVRVFCAAATQWRLGPAGLAGFDYNGVRAAAAGIGVRWRDIFGRLRLMESEVLTAQAEEAK